MEIKKPEMFEMAEEGGKAKLWEQILMFIVVFLIATVVGSIPASIMSTTEMTEAIINGANYEKVQNTMLSSPSYVYMSLYGTILSIIAVVLFTKFKDKRSLRSLGFIRKNVVRDYLVGIFIGFVMFSLVIGINLITGAMTTESLINNLDGAAIGLIVVFLIGFLFQGAYEEILVRGYLMVNIGAKHKVSTAVLITSIIFAVMHLGNPGLTFIGVLNLVLIAIFFGLYIICFNNIWGACAMHSVWNFVQGNFYGVKVSGMDTFASVFATTNVPGKEFINGGAFGAEGGIATTIVCVLAIAILLSYMKKKGQIQKRIIGDNTIIKEQNL